MRSTIGYMLHGWKNLAYCPAVILNDEMISDNPEGGSGKKWKDVTTIQIFDARTGDMIEFIAIHPMEKTPPEKVTYGSHTHIKTIYG